MKKGDRRYQSQKIAQHIKNKTHQKHHEENLRIGVFPMFGPNYNFSENFFGQFTKNWIIFKWSDDLREG